MILGDIDAGISAGDAGNLLPRAHHGDAAGAGRRDDLARPETHLMHLAEDAGGKGIMTRSVKAVLHYAFENLKLNKIEIRCGVGNAKSRAIPERLGFKLDGILRDEEWLYDHFHDIAVYSLLASEWKEIR